MVVAARLHRSTPKELCPVDDWGFDPRYTAGACPICGWRPDGAAANTPPLWRQRVDQVPWDLVALGVLFVVLVALGILVGIAARVNLVPS